ncbi:MAG: type II toxin-antitoxin system YafQ family toxin [Candidatus Paceibacterota bacterium]|jgi:mRNA interferase YafQ
MLIPFPTKQYEKSFKKLKHSGKFNETELNKIIDALCREEKLGSIYQDHNLHGEYDGYRECHIQGNILLIYRIEGNKLVLVLFDIGTHSELF